MPPDSTIFLSIVAPAHNERENLEQLIDEIDRAIAPTGLTYEIIVVDDGSTDDSGSLLRALQRSIPHLRILTMCRTPRGRGNGQSAAFHVGFRAARGELIAVLDADLQNDPADIPTMLDLMQRTGCDFVQGDRSRARRDGLVKRVTSRVGRTARRLLLGDSIRDTGCSLRIMRRQVALAIPLEFRGMHRFIPLTARQLGYDVREIPVQHRPRSAGKSKYGVLDRGWEGLWDCFAVRWMHSRRRSVAATEHVAKSSQPIKSAQLKE